MTRTDTPNGLGRRGFLTVLGGGLAVAALQGCTNDANDPQPSGSGGSTGSDAEAFPVTVTHRFGETTITSAPQRVVALGQTDCDPLIALGITPIAIGSFLDDWYDPVFPWNESGFPEKPEEVRFYDLEFEKIAALSPDLITMVSGGISKKDFETLSKIAPVVGPPEGYQDSAVPYGPHTLLIGQCVGKEAEAKAAVEAWTPSSPRCARSIPTGRGSPRSTPRPTPVPTTCSASTHRGPPSSRRWASRSPPSSSEIVGDDYSKEISAEELDLVGDLDLVVWCTDEGAIPDVQKNPVISRLPAVDDGNAIWTHLRQVRPVHVVDGLDTV